MMDPLTTDWTQFGLKEIEEAKELLSHIKEIETYGKVEVFFNTHSGFVFLSDEESRTWMMNKDKIEEWYSCPICGHEGFLEDMEHGEDNEECIEYLRQIDAIPEEEEGSE